MHLYIRNLVALVLALSSASLVTPSLAQNLTESNKDNTSNIIPQSPQSISATGKSDSSSPGNTTVIVSETDSKASSSASVVTPKPNPRIFIPSRVFATPSMQQ